jgi:hypothetical protein
LVDYDNCHMFGDIELNLNAPVKKTNHSR